MIEMNIDMIAISAEFQCWLNFCPNMKRELITKSNLITWIEKLHLIEANKSQIEAFIDCNVNA